MKLEDITNDLNLAKMAARESGKLLVKSKIQINERLNTDSKDTKLRADIESENLIKSLLSANSDYPILAEESGSSSKDLGDIFWVVDPLDGTANYHRDIPICCVSIGLIYQMNPILGVVYDFNNDDLYSGDKFSKLSKLDENEIHVSNKTKKEDSILITGLPHNSDFSEKSLHGLIKDMQIYQKVRMIGSAAMAACYVASGKAEVYKEKGIYLWDIIAGAAIVESAGGTAKISNQKDNFQVDVVFSNSKF